jgi:hypothetical protein
VQPGAFPPSLRQPVSVIVPVLGSREKIAIDDWE